MNGVYFAAIYCRTGKNTWFLILVHGLYDFAGLNLGAFLSAQAIKPAPELDFKRALSGFLFWAAIYGVSTAIILRTKKIKPLLDAVEGRH